MNWDTAQQFIRLSLQFVAGLLVSQGYLNEEMASTATGALLALASVGWWFFWNRRRVE